MPFPPELPPKPQSNPRDRYSCDLVGRLNVARRRYLWAKYEKDDAKAAHHLEQVRRFTRLIDARNVRFGIPPRSE